MAVNGLLLSKDVISEAKLRHKRLKVVRYYRNIKRIIHLYIRSEKHRDLYGSSELIKIHDNQKTKFKII